MSASRRHSPSRNRRRSSRKSSSFFRDSSAARRKINASLRLIPEVFADKGSTKSASTLGHLSLALSASFYGLTALFTVSIVFSLFPLRLSQADWYLRQFASFAEAAPLLIAALSFALASIFCADSTRVAAKRLLLLRRIIRPLVVIVCLLFPVQLALGARFANRNYNANRAEVIRLSDQNKKLTDSISSSDSKKKFQEILLKRGIGVDTERLDSISLPEAKAQALAVINQQFNRQATDFRIQRRRRLVTDLMDASRLLVSWLAISFFFISYQGIARSLSLRSLDWRKKQSIR